MLLHFNITGCVNSDVANGLLEVFLLPPVFDSFLFCLLILSGVCGPKDRAVDHDHTSQNAMLAKHRFPFQVAGVYAGDGLRAVSIWGGK